jgi:hypothetical protein
LHSSFVTYRSFLTRTIYFRLFERSLASLIIVILNDCQLCVPF